MLLSTLLMMTVALAMLTYDDDHDKDEGADDDDHQDGAYIVLFLFCSSPFSLFLLWRLPCFRGPCVVTCCTESEDSKMRCHTPASLSFEFI